MQASTIVGTLALLLAALLIAGYAHSQDPAAPEAKAAPELKTMQEKVQEREAIRRAAAAEQQKPRGARRDAKAPGRIHPALLQAAEDRRRVAGVPRRLSANVGNSGSGTN